MKTLAIIFLIFGLLLIAALAWEAYTPREMTPCYVGDPYYCDALQPHPLTPAWLPAASGVLWLISFGLLIKRSYGAFIILNILIITGAILALWFTNQDRYLGPL